MNWQDWDDDSAEERYHACCDCGERLGSIYIETEHGFKIWKRKCISCKAEHRRVQMYDGTHHFICTHHE